ncbi:hypothetical protein AB1Y20_002230 [Prymnesium parvum]|uniref:Uncharacterized protein n=1 Tax=Prymnesium parvum TaxID=97485 RepID=A0AB34JAI2_PRYPA
MIDDGHVWEPNTDWYSTVEVTRYSAPVATTPPPPSPPPAPRGPVRLTPPRRQRQPRPAPYASQPARAAPPPPWPPAPPLAAPRRTVAPDPVPHPPGTPSPVALLLHGGLSFGPAASIESFRLLAASLNQPSSTLPPPSRN